ncbi:hypothetical protein ACOSQ2_022525 [Xanthoceras sorbifolium]
MEALIQRIPRVPAPIKKSTINSFTDSPFVDAIALVEMPRKFNFPNMKPYDGTTDPDDHIAQYRQRILLHDSDLYKELTKYPCKTMEDVLAKAWAQIKWEEDEVNYYPSRSNQGDNRYNSRVERRNVERRTDPYPIADCRNDKVSDSRRRPIDRPHPQTEKPRYRVPEYNLNIKPQEIVVVFKGMGGAVRWPAKLKSPPDQRDSSKWCEFHGDHGHKTEDCIGLRFEVIELLKRGHVKEYLTDKGKST